jgi:hypothetical protein
MGANAVGAVHETTMSEGSAVCIASSTATTRLLGELGVGSEVVCVVVALLFSAFVVNSSAAYVTPFVSALAGKT